MIKRVFLFKIVISRNVKLSKHTQLGADAPG